MVDTSGSETSGGPAIGLPVDGHVHFHRRRLVEPTLDAALRNLRGAAGRTDGLVGMLLLTQARAEHVFEELQRQTSVGGWSLTATACEPQTLIARRDGAELAIVCGRQVRAEAGLEVLALGTGDEFPDDRPLAATIDAVHDAGALAVLPWGFGKWLGKRGELVRATLTSVGRERLFIGDNGGRLAGAPTPAIVRRFEELGFRVLPGTDPFPFGGDCRRVGSFGFVAEVAGEQEAPWTRVRESLLSNSVSPRPFGVACPAARFVFNQVGVQIYNRLPRGALA